MKVNAEKYTAHRRKLLKEEMKLVYDRDKVSKTLRDLRKEMRAWDNVLINDGED